MLCSHCLEILNNFTFEFVFCKWSPMRTWTMHQEFRACLCVSSYRFVIVVVIVLFFLWCQGLNPGSCACQALYQLNYIPSPFMWPARNLFLMLLVEQSIAAICIPYCWNTYHTHALLWECARGNLYFWESREGNLFWHLHHLSHFIICFILHNNIINMINYTKWTKIS